jgi:hypothetical protein
MKLNGSIEIQTERIILDNDDDDDDYSDKE